MRSKHIYTKRFGTGTLMRYFWDEAFRLEYLEWVASIKSDEYYIRMKMQRICDFIARWMSVLVLTVGIVARIYA